MTDYSAISEIQTFPMSKQPGTTYVAPAAKSETGEVISRAVQTIGVDAQTLFAYWSDLGSIPLWQEQVVSVTAVSDKVSHWVMGNPEDPDGKRIEFDAETTSSIPGKEIAWTSITPEVDQSGRVTFAETSRGTLVRLVESVKVPGGNLGNALAGIAKRSPSQTVIENLRHFKEMAETGSIPSVRNQPHGPRGMSGSIKEWMYGESNPTPPGSEVS